MIVLTWQDYEMTAECVHAIAGIAEEVIIVDNGSDLEVAAQLAELASLPVVTVLRSNSNLGFAGGMNLGLAAATRTTVIFANNDVRPDRDSVEILARECALPGVGAAFPAISDASGRDATAAGRFLTLRRAIALATGISAIPFLKQSLTTSPADAEWFSGPFVAMQRVLANSIGGIPTHSFFYSEDYRLCHRLTTLNLQCRFVPTAKVMHRDNASAATLWTAAGISERQTYELLRAAIDHQPTRLRKLALTSAFTFAAWTRDRLRRSESSASVLSASRLALSGLVRSKQDDPRRQLFEASARSGKS